MKLAFFGDVVGRSGRDLVCERLPKLKKERGWDFVVVNGDNAAGGFGITPDVANDFLKAGADCVTGGDHIWDQKEIIPYLSQSVRLLRPHNFPDSTPGTGCKLYETSSGKKVLVLHLLGQVFHKEHLDCPFASAKKALESYRLGAGIHAIIVDMHAEATSEKCAMGHFLDGKVSLVVGSHTHIPTADERILKGGTAYQTDAGMCGDYDSVIGFDAEVPIQSFLTKIRKGRMSPGSGAGTLCGVEVETDDATGLAKSIERLSIR